ncbi:hypothetical protein [Bradyrhizobium sp. Ash2021]|uniref:hypothetical protein n=1 Tax=Bradyrhizobium sp. Ash2021 TaxID=2954771 RepID=UPI002815693C|nr:hypothetical protein [Bradyrhizobium sp. Ash2021]WMT75953.1 hypothetical protein NL528_06040 [Bradyrhizobium sp. Ash2021]
MPNQLSRSDSAHDLLSIAASALAAVRNDGGNYAWASSAMRGENPRHPRFAHSDLYLLDNGSNVEMELSAMVGNGFPNI